MFYKDSDCSYQSKYSCLPPITVNVTCESTGQDGDGCCCSKDSIRDVLNYILTPAISQYINLNTIDINGIKSLLDQGSIISVSNDLVYVDTNPIDKYISLCSIYDIHFVATNASALETAIRANPLFSSDITVPDDPCCCKGEIIDKLEAARTANTTVILDMERISDANISGKVIGIAPDIVWIRGVTGAGVPNNNFHIASICRIASIAP